MWEPWRSKPNGRRFFVQPIPGTLLAGVSGGTHALACAFEASPAPPDTVRALSPGRGRQSSAQGFTFSTAGGDTSPGNLPHLTDSFIGWLAAIGVLGQGKESGLPPQIVAASHPVLSHLPIGREPAKAALFSFTRQYQFGDQNGCLRNSQTRRSSISLRRESAMADHGPQPDCRAIL